MTDPLASVTQFNSIHSQSIVDFYDDVMFSPMASQFFGQGNHNFGYWTSSTNSVGEANQELFQQLLARVSNLGTCVLDVACGVGGNLRRLLSHYPAKNITGINISAKQLEACRALVPGVELRQSDACTMELAEAHFDLILCVEAAFHFSERLAFLRRARHGLKKGAFLALTDILFTQTPAHAVPLVPKENFGLSEHEYRALYTRSGFEVTTFEDWTEQTIVPFSAAACRQIELGSELGMLSSAQRDSMLEQQHTYLRNCRPYVCVVAQAC